MKHIPWDSGEIPIPPKISLHAKGRIRQRGLREKDILFVCQYGQPCKEGGNDVRFMSRKNEQRVASQIDLRVRHRKCGEKEARQTKALMEKIRGVAVYLAEEKERKVVKTVYRLSRKQVHALMKRMKRKAERIRRRNRRP